MTAIVNESVVVIMTSIVVYSAFRRRFSSQEIRNSKYICCQIDRYPSSSDVATDAATLAAADDGGGGGEADDDVPATCSIVVFFRESATEPPTRPQPSATSSSSMSVPECECGCLSVHPPVCLAVCLHAKWPWLRLWLFVAEEEVAEDANAVAEGQKSTNNVRGVFLHLFS